MTDSGGSSPKKLLERFGLKPKRSFGQNFLADVHYCERIATLATPEPGLEVIEIGAGLGALTGQLLSRAGRVVAIERDRDLVPALRELYAAELQDGRLEVLEADAKQVDFLGCFGAEPRRRVVSGNLPYQITGPLVEKVVGMAREIRRGVFLVQKEVADRLASAPDTSDYGVLSIFVQAQFEVERAFVAKRGAFYPQPGVDSAVVVLEPRATPITDETVMFRKVVKSAFAARRKTLRNAWRGLASAEVLEAASSAAGVSLEQRGETLSVAQFAAIARSLEEAQGGPT